MKVQRNERGQTTIFFVFFLGLVFMGMAALAIDVGVLYRQKRMVQAAADASAIAASAQYSATGNASIVTSAAKTAAQQQAGGILPGEVTPTLVNAANADVQVVIAHPTDTLFLGVLNSAWKTINVSAMSEAAIPANQPGLNTNNLTLNSGASVTGANCGINDNDSNGNDLNLNSGVTIDVTSFHVHGSAPSTRPNCGSCPTYDPLPTYSTPVVTDPYKGLTAPTTSGLTVQQAGNYSPSSPATINLQPGIYNGISFNSGITTVNLASGLYYMKGTVNVNTNVTINGTGVTLYFDSGALNMNSSANVNLTAPTSALSNCASCSGMLVWESATDTTTMMLNSGDSASWGGAIYVPDAQLTLNGGSKAAGYGQIYANSVMLNSAISMTCPAGGGKMRLVQ
jgi:hypothetical protein